jgi:hypothetical protein
MGTPHRGSSVASLGKVVANAAKLCSIGISVSHLNSLLPDSRELSELSTEFGQNIFSPPVKVINFFESKKTKIGLMRTPVGFIWLTPSPYMNSIDFINRLYHILPQLWTPLDLSKRVFL